MSTLKGATFVHEYLKEPTFKLCGVFELCKVFPCFLEGRLNRIFCQGVVRSEQAPCCGKCLPMVLTHKFVEAGLLANI